MTYAGSGGEFTSVKHMSHPLIEAIAPVAEAIGAEVFEGQDPLPTDIPLVWEGTTVGFLRLAGSPVDLDWYLRSVEREMGGPLGELTREDKQRAVKLLNERGAFGLRRSVEQVAEALGVSRFTVYNYLNRPESNPGTGPGSTPEGSAPVRDRRP